MTEIIKYILSFEAELSTDKFDMIELVNCVDILLKKEFGNENVKFKRLYTNEIGEE